MYCPNCGKEIGDDFNFCPFCEANLRGNLETFSQPASEEIKPVNRQPPKEANLDEKIYYFLKQNQRAKFTTRALFNRLHQITDSKSEIIFTLNQLEGELDKFVWDGELNVEYLDGEKYYSVNQKVTEIISGENGPSHNIQDRSIKEVLYEFLKKHKGRSFSVERIMTALDKEMGQLNSDLYSIQSVRDLLNSLVREGSISSDTLGGDKYYIFRGDDSSISKVKPVQYTPPPKSSEGGVIAVLVIFAVIGIILTIVGAFNWYTSFGITFIILGVLLTGVGTKGRCFFIFLACDDCDCDCDC